MRDLINIRNVAENDFNAIMQIEDEEYDGKGYDFYFIRMIPYIFQKTCLIASINKKDVGYVLGAFEDSNPKNAWILSMVVSLSVRNKGVGATLINSSIKKLKDLGAEKIYLTVSEDNFAAIHLYEKYNFKKIDFIENFFGNNKHRILMCHNA